MAAGDWQTQQIGEQNARVARDRATCHSIWDPHRIAPHDMAPLEARCKAEFGCRWIDEVYNLDDSIFRHGQCPHVTDARDQVGNRDAKIGLVEDSRFHPNNLRVSCDTFHQGDTELKCTLQFNARTTLKGSDIVILKLTAPGMLNRPTFSVVSSGANNGDYPTPDLQSFFTVRSQDGLFILTKTQNPIQNNQDVSVEGGNKVATFYLRSNQPLVPNPGLDQDSFEVLAKVGVIKQEQLPQRNIWNERDFLFSGFFKNRIVIQRAAPVQARQAVNLPCAAANTYSRDRMLICQSDAGQLLWKMVRNTHGCAAVRNGCSSSNVCVSDTCVAPQAQLDADSVSFFCNPDHVEQNQRISCRLQMKYPTFKDMQITVRGESEGTLLRPSVTAGRVAVFYQIPDAAVPYLQVMPGSSVLNGEQFSIQGTARLARYLESSRTVGEIELMAPGKDTNAEFTVHLVVRDTNNRASTVDKTFRVRVGAGPGQVRVDAGAGGADASLVAGAGVARAGGAATGCDYNGVTVPAGRSSADSKYVCVISSLVECTRARNGQLSNGYLCNYVAPNIYRWQSCTYDNQRLVQTDRIACGLVDGVAQWKVCDDSAHADRLFVSGVTKECFTNGGRYRFETVDANSMPQRDEPQVNEPDVPAPVADPAVVVYAEDTNNDGCVNERDVDSKLFAHGKASDVAKHLKRLAKSWHKNKQGGRC